jgi:hypothetical protein
MQMMHWYNPTTRTEEDVPAPMSDAQAIEMLSGHPDSDWFIEEYQEVVHHTRGCSGSPGLDRRGVLLGAPQGAATGVKPGKTLS